MKLKIMAAIILLLSMITVSCDETTGTAGTSLTDAMDMVVIGIDTLNVNTRSIKVDSVLNRTTRGAVGSIKDPETGAIVSGNITTTLHVLDGIKKWDKEKLYSYATDQKIEADSCMMRFYINKFEGDSLAPMKVTLYELSTPMTEADVHYSNYDPMKEGLVRTDANGIKISKVFTITDHTLTDEQLASDNYRPGIAFALNKPYTARNGQTYKNYGSYVMQMYYDHPEYFTTSQKFAKYVCPGFYLKSESGTGCIGYVSSTNLSIFYRVKADKDSIINTYLNLSGTEEVLQHSSIVGDSHQINSLVNDHSCTYVKTPAGIFTEVELPVEGIMKDHENDTLNTAKVSFQRMNSKVEGNYKLGYPTRLLMVQKDSLFSYFEHNCIPDNKQSYLATCSSNLYTFSNISNLIRHMYDLKKTGRASENWNKVVLVPVEATLNSSNAVVKVTNLMDVTSTRLVGGEDHNKPIRISVIYSMFNGH